MASWPTRKWRLCALPEKNETFRLLSEKDASLLLIEVESGYSQTVLEELEKLDVNPKLKYLDLPGTAVWKIKSYNT